MKRRFSSAALLAAVLIMAFVSGLTLIGCRLTVGKSVAPLPPDVASLPTITAKPWLQVGTDPNTNLEGPAFDRQGNLFLTDTTQGLVFKITPQKQVTKIFDGSSKIRTDGIAIHKDGRLFINCISGELMSMNPDGSNLTYITARTPQNKPGSMNDLVFDSKGNLYVTDYTGNVGNPTGGVYRFSSDFTTVQPVLERLAAANGISLSPAENMLWVAESGRNSVITIALSADGVTPSSIRCPFYSTGLSVDSNRVDEAGNLYQAIRGQGRIIILNAQSGIPIANVLVTGRDEGKYLNTTNLAFKPGTNEGYITTGGKGGAWIFTFEALAKGLTLFSSR